MDRCTRLGVGDDLHLLDKHFLSALQEMALADGAARLGTQHWRRLSGRCCTGSVQITVPRIGPPASAYLRPPAALGGRFRGDVHRWSGHYLGALGTLVHPPLTGPAAQEGCATDLKLGAAALGAPSIHPGQSSPVAERKRQFSSVALSLFPGKSQEYVISGHSVLSVSLFTFSLRPFIPPTYRRPPGYGLIEAAGDTPVGLLHYNTQHRSAGLGAGAPRYARHRQPTTKHHYRHHEREESHEAAGIPPISATTAGPATWSIAVPERHRGGGQSAADHHGPRSP
jgi:hypothetical protein